MPTLPPYLDQLDLERQGVFKKLALFANNFVLAGGTAIMLQIGHRLSYDFDCFSENELSPNILRQTKKIFGPSIFPRVNTAEQISFSANPSIEVTFVYHPYPSLKTPIKTHSLPIFHLDDLIANKAYTIGRRGAWRDYVDLFFLLKWKLYDLSTITHLAQKKFAGEFHDKLFLEQLTYYSDLKILPIEFLKESYTPEEIQSYLETQVESYIKTILP